MNAKDKVISRLTREIHALKQNIKQLQKSEANLKVSEEKLRILFDFAPDGYFLCDPEGNILNINIAAENITALKRHELIGRNILKTKLLHKSSIPRAVKFLSDTAAGHPCGPEEFVVLRNDRSQLFVEVTTLPINIKGKSIILGIARDISRRKKVEAELLENEHRYRSIFNFASDGIAVMQAGGKELMVNESFARMHGYDNQAEMGKVRLPDLDTPETNKLAPERLRRLLAGETLNFEVEHYRKNGSTFPLYVSCKVIDIGGKKYFLGFHRDVTERKKAENALKESKEHLRALSLRLAEIQENERKVISRELHDQVGQTLSVLGINLTDLKNRLPRNDEKAEILDGALEQIEELTEYIQNLTLELRPSILDDYGLFSALNWYSQRLSRRIGLPISIHGKEIRSRRMPEAEVALFRIAQDALTNIAKHARASRAVVSLKENHDIIRLIVSDDGKGFNVKSIQKKRSGWGLLIMRERITALGGSLKIESSPGRGTRITAELRK